MTKFKFIGLLILLFIISFAIPNIAIGSAIFAIGFITLIIFRIAFKVKQNKIEVENARLLNEKLKQDINK